MSTSTPAAGGRLLSLDIARGMVIAFMIMVNNNGADAYPPFRHALWNGWTPTDLVFPSFVFLVGTSVVLSLSKRIATGTPRAQLIPGILKRSALLFLLGLVVNGFPFFDLAHLRIYGVLQRIALCYLVAALLYLWQQRATPFIVVSVVLLVGYYILMRFVPVPGAGLPGRDIPLLDTDQNWVAWLDRHLLPGRLYEGVRDPEGLLSTFPAMVTSLLGLLTGMWIRTERTRDVIAKGMTVAAIGLLIAGQLWNLVFPINKKLWTSSYVLFAAGCTLLLLSCLYWIVDVKDVRQAWEKPWLVFGTNAIYAYMFSELLAPTLFNVKVHGRTLWAVLYDASFRHITPAGVGSLCYSVSFMLVCWLATYPLWKRKIFLRV